MPSSRWRAMNFRMAPKGPRALAKGQGILRQEEKLHKQLQGVPAPVQEKGSSRHHLRRREKRKKDAVLFGELGSSIKTVSIFWVHLPEAASVHSAPYLKHGRAEVAPHQTAVWTGCSQFQRNGVPRTRAPTSPKGGRDQEH